MRVFFEPVFDDFVVGTTAVYTRPELNDKLGRVDKLYIQAVSDQVSGTSPTLSVQIEQSNDQRNWAKENGSAEIPAASVVVTGTNDFRGNDAGATPSGGAVRLRIQMGGTNNPTAHVKVYVCGRDEGG